MHSYSLEVMASAPTVHYIRTYTHTQFRFLNDPKATLQFLVCFLTRNFSSSLCSRPYHISLQGPFCEFNSKTCLGAVPPLFDYIDGVNPCLCVDAVTVFDRDLAIGLFRIAMCLACLLLLQCITSPCLSAIPSDVVRKVAKVLMPTLFLILLCPLFTPSCVIIL
jgi:hypothetical protein